MMAFFRDLRYALRQLRKSPGFTITAILTLTLGIGAATTIFTLADNTLLRPLRYPHSDRMVAIEEQTAKWHDLYPTLPVNANHLSFWQQHDRSFSAIAAMQPESQPLESGGSPVRIGVLQATASFFSVFQVEPQLGRAFLTQEERQGQEHEIVLLHGLWQSQFHADPKIIGKTIHLAGWPYIVVGVMPASFHLPASMARGFMAGANRIEAITPLSFSANLLQEVMSDFDYLSIGRLKPGVSVAQATEETNALEHTIAAQLPANEASTLSAVITPYRQYLAGSDRRSLAILLAAVAGILLIGCINITNLLLARFTSRRKELALRTALGASRLRVTGTATMEALLLAAGGGVLGIAAAVVAVPMLQRYVPAELNFSGPMHVDATGAVCTVLLVVVAAVLAGLPAAWMASGTDPQEALHSESRSASESRQGKRLRKTLVGAEVALAVALLVLTGLLTASMVHLLRVPRGFDATKVIAANILLPDKVYRDKQTRINFYRKLVAKLETMPGAKSAGIISVLPLDGNAWGDAIVPVGSTGSHAQQPSGNYRWISPGFFNALHLPLIAGRFLSPADFGHPYAVISEQTAKTIWPGQNPIGRQFHRGNPDEPPFTVIGVVGNAHSITLNKADPMLVYVGYWYRSDESAGIVVRTAQDPLAMANTLRRTIWSVDPQIAVPSVRTMNHIVGDSLAQRRFEMDLLGLFAASALLLAMLGVYGVVNYSVVQRMQEMGIRLALGAQPGNIYRQVLWEGLPPLLVGAAAGVCIAFASGRLIASLLFGVSAYDPLVAITAGCLLVGVGVLACLIPARRAAHVDPMLALRNE